MKKILVIATHPDDEVLGCGATIARHVDAGDQVTIAIATRGAPDLFSDEFMARIRAELQAAQAVLKVTDVRFLDFPAPKLDTVPAHQVADAISKVIRSTECETIYLPHRGDIHADHRAVYQATLVAARPIDNLKVRQLLCYETLSETEWAPPIGADAFIPTVFIDISATLDRKLSAMKCYASQLKEHPHPRSLQSIEAQAHLRGATVGFMAAEAFMLVREVVP
jgi:LmbE family N-acetylglucosaminyl deacetylase